MWKSYTVFIFRALAELGKPRKIRELYQRWESLRLLPEAVFMAGVALFNLGRFKQAAGVWGRLPAWASRFPDIAELVNRGVIPAFPLEYVFPQAPSDTSELKGYVSTGNGKMAILGMALEDEEHRTSALEILVGEGDWGKELAFNILDSTAIDKELKMYALFAMNKVGLLEEGESVSVWLDGEHRDIEVRVHGEPEEIINTARTLAKKGDYQQASDLLEKFMAMNDEFDPHICFFLVHYLLMDEDLTKAKGYMDKMIEYLPDSPYTKYLQALYFFRKQDLVAARALLAGIENPDSELAEPVQRLNAAVSMMGTFKKHLSIRGRTMVKTLPRSPSLARGLKNLPVELLWDACEYWGLDDSGKRDEVQQRLVDFIGSEKGAKQCWLDLDAEEKELLRYLLANDGWAKMSAVTREFGTPLEDSPAAGLWETGLICVGTASIKGEKTKIVTVPVELRQHFARFASE